MAFFQTTAQYCFQRALTTYFSVIILKEEGFLDPFHVYKISDFTLFGISGFAPLQQTKRAKRQIFSFTQSLIIFQRISVLLVVVLLSFAHMTRDSIRLLFPGNTAVGRIKPWGDFNLDETLIHKIQSKTDNKQA